MGGVCWARDLQEFGMGYSFECAGMQVSGGLSDPRYMAALGRVI